MKKLITRYCAGPLLLTICLPGHPALSMEPFSLHQLVFKGTHNSYINSEGCDNIGGVCYPVADAPWMNHDLRQQIDEFGAWTVELDYSVNYVSNYARCQVGHNEVGNPAGFVSPPFFLTDYLRPISTAHALDYRPVIIYFEKKETFGDESLHPAKNYIPILEQELISVFGDRIFGPQALHTFLSTNNNKYPTVPQLAGKIIPVSVANDCDTIKYCTNSIFRPEKVYDSCAQSAPIGLGFSKEYLVADHCTSLPNVVAALTPGRGIVRLDQYQADWTYNYGVPPNPIVVSNTAPAFQVVNDSVGQSWSCDGDSWKGNVVGEHGTYRFPYRTVKAAVDRAAGIVPGLPFESTRTGYGWTVLLSPGSYSGAISITNALTLKNASPGVGGVTIGR